MAGLRLSQSFVFVAPCGAGRQTDDILRAKRTPEAREDDIAEEEHLLAAFSLNVRTLPWQETSRSRVDHATEPVEEALRDELDIWRS